MATSSVTRLRGTVSTALVRCRNGFAGRPRELRHSHVAGRGTRALRTGLAGSWRPRKVHHRSLTAVWISRRIGLVRTMVFTHLPSSVCLVLVPFMPSLGPAIVLLLIRSALSQMDVPTRTSYVMAVVTPAERAAAASVTAVPRSLTAAVSPTIAGLLLSVSSFGWPLVIGGLLKITYDLLLLRLFRDVRPPEEGGASPEQQGR